MSGASLCELCGQSERCTKCGGETGWIKPEDVALGCPWHTWIAVEVCMEGGTLWKCETCGTRKGPAHHVFGFCGCEESLVGESLGTYFSYKLIKDKPYGRQVYEVSYNPMAYQKGKPL